MTHFIVLLICVVGNRAESPVNDSAEAADDSAAESVAWPAAQPESQKE